jgi:hypothetical protein
MRIGNRSDRRALEKLISAAPMESKARMAMGALKVGVRVLVASKNISQIVAHGKQDYRLRHRRSVLQQL